MKVKERIKQSIDNGTFKRKGFLPEKKKNMLN